MELTKIAQGLKEATESSRGRTEEEERLATCMGSEDFSYNLYEGGYLKPEEWLIGKDLEEVQKAIKKVGEFKEIVESLHDEF